MSLSANFTVWLRSILVFFLLLSFMLGCGCSDTESDVSNNSYAGKKVTDDDDDDSGDDDDNNNDEDDDDDTTQIPCEDCITHLELCDKSSIKGLSVAGPKAAWAEGPYGESSIFFYNGSETVQVTHGEGYDDLPQTDGVAVFWIREGGWDPSESEIYHWDGADIRQLTDNSFNEQQLDIDIDGSLVWMEGNSSDMNTFERYRYHGQNIDRITSNAVHDGRPKIDEGRIIWVSGDIEDRNNLEIFVFDGEIQQLTFDALYDDNPVISGERAAWEVRDANDIARSDIRLFNDGSVTCLTDNTRQNTSPSIDGSLIAWQSCEISDLTGESCEILVHDIEADTLSQLTNNTAVDSFPAVFDGVVMWGVNQAEPWITAEISLCSEGDTHLVTSDSFPDYAAQLSVAGGWSAWARFNADLERQEVALGLIECLKKCEN